MTNNTDYLELMERELVRMDYSDDTVETYKICLKQLSAHFPALSPENISLEEIKEYFNFLITRKRISPSYLYQTRSALHFFYNNLLKKDYDLSSVQLPKRTRPTPEILTPAEIVALLNSTEYFWQRIVFALIYSTGLEVSEAVNLRVNDIDFQNRVIRIWQARRKDPRKANLSESLCNDLNEYVNTYGLTKWLFRGQQKDSHISTDRIRRVFNRSIRAAGITKKVTVKSLRYSYAKHLERQGIPLRNILMELGIYSGQSLQVFSDIDAVDIIVPSPLDATVSGKNVKIGSTNTQQQGIDHFAYDLGFVKNQEIREILHRDINELNVVLSQGIECTVKTCMILCGSIAETMLLDSLIEREKEVQSIGSTLPRRVSSNLEEWDLHDMVTVASHLNPPLLPEDATKSASQLREWRNLIHPGRELRDTRYKKIRPSVARAQSALSFLRFIAEELTK